MEDYVQSSMQCPGDVYIVRSESSRLPSVTMPRSESATKEAAHDPRSSLGQARGLFHRWSAAEGGGKKEAPFGTER